MEQAKKEIKTLEDLRDRSELWKRIRELEEENKKLRSELKPWREFEKILRKKGCEMKQVQVLVESLQPNQSLGAVTITYQAVGYQPVTPTHVEDSDGSEDDSGKKNGN